MTDKELADKVVALGVGSWLYKNMLAWPDDNHWILESKFVRDWRVFGALLEKDIEDNGHPPIGDWPHDAREGIEVLVEALS